MSGATSGILAFLWILRKILRIVNPDIPGWLIVAILVLSAISSIILLVLVVRRKRKQQKYVEEQIELQKQHSCPPKTMHDIFPHLQTSSNTPLKKQPLSQEEYHESDRLDLENQKGSTDWW